MEGWNGIYLPLFVGVVSNRKFQVFWNKAKTVYVFAVVFRF